MEQNMSDIVTVSTLIGYVKIKCLQSSTVDVCFFFHTFSLQEITKAAVKKVSISNSPFMFGLEIKESPSTVEDRQFLCPKLNWSEIAGLVTEQNILLSIRFFPTNFEDYVRKDRSTLYYLHDQVGSFRFYLSKYYLR